MMDLQVDVLEKFSFKSSLGVTLALLFVFCHRKSHFINTGWEGMVSDVEFVTCEQPVEKCSERFGGLWSESGRPSLVLVLQSDVSVT